MITIPHARKQVRKQLGRVARAQLEGKPGQLMQQITRYFKSYSARVVAVDVANKKLLKNARKGGALTQVYRMHGSYKLRPTLTHLHQKMKRPT